MDKFDKILKEAVEGYEAPYNPQAWANVSDKMGFDKVVKEAVDGYQAPYNPQAWANVSSQLGSNGGGVMKWIIGSAAVATLVVGTVYFIQDDEAQPQSTPVVADQTIESAQNNDDLAIDGTTDDQSLTYGHNLDADGNPMVSDPAISNPSDDPRNPGITGSGTPNGQNSSDPANGGNPGNVVVPTVTNHVDPVIVANPEATTVRYNAKFNALSDVQCSGAEFVFTPEELDQNVIYAWDFGDGTYSTSKVGRHAFKKAGNYEVHLVLKDNKTNKIVGNNSIDVTVNPQPNTQFSWEQSNDIIPTVNFINLTEDAQIWSWNITGLKTSAQNQFEYTFRKKGTYVVELTSENEFGCQSTLQKTIDIKNDYNLYAPTAFQPNGDGVNDYFIPEALKIMDVQFTMIISDKSGKRMYQTTNASTPWDGTNMSDGSMAPDGAYVWQVQFKNAYGEMEFYEGQVIIIR